MIYRDHYGFLTDSSRDGGDSANFHGFFVWLSIRLGTLTELDSDLILKYFKERRKMDEMHLMFLKYLEKV